MKPQVLKKNHAIKNGNTNNQVALLLVIFMSVAGLSCSDENMVSYANENWASYLGDNSVSHYSLLDQINKGNVHLLKQAWMYDGGHASESSGTQIQCNPLIIDGILYGTTATMKLVALDARSGKEIWQFDPSKELPMVKAVNRGLAYWQDGHENALLYAVGACIFSVDPLNGRLISSFGDKGKVNLKKGLGRDGDNLFFSANTPGIVYKDLFIVGGKVSESIGHLPGHIRAYDVRTGEMKWIFHTIPYPDEFGYETWSQDAYQKSGGANAWTGFSLDEKRGIVYVPTGSASFDFYGGDRVGANLFANCIIALDANTGERIWHYQTVHHDVFDYDLPAPPNLITLQQDGEEIDALVQTSKLGFLYVLNRETGEPIYPIVETEVPQTDLEGEQTWPTQPIPTVYPTFSRTVLTEDDLAIRSEEARTFAMKLWENSHKGQLFIPPTTTGTLLFPGMNGGGEWGGAAVDPNTQVLYVNSNECAYMLKMSRFEPGSTGEGIYQMRCQACHGADREGSSMFGNVPALTKVKESLDRTEMINIVKNGRGVMPAFSMLEESEIENVVDYLRGFQTNPIKESDPNWPYPYVFEGYKRLVAPDNLPITRPPWGQLTAIDLNKAEIKWQIPLGNVDSLDVPGHPVTGTMNYGGPVLTAGGILFIAATADAKIRAYDKDTGELLWEAQLPKAGFATPATYSVEGKQYIVIACGGGKLEQESGDYYVAFALDNE